MAIKIIIADDHPIIIEGITAIIKRENCDIEIIGAVSNGKELLELIKTITADVYILDISMPFLNGLETSKKLLEINPQAKIIIFSMLDSKNLVDNSIRIGVKAYISKEYLSDEIIRAIKEVMNDNIYLSSNVSSLVIEDLFGKKTSNDLTKREKEILQLLVHGNTNKKIALQLNLSFETINVHKKNIMKKLSIHKETELIKYAIKEGITYL